MRQSKGTTVTRFLLHYAPDEAGSGEEIVLGGLKTKNVDVVVTKPRIGPVLAVSCKGVTKAFRNLTNRMEETIGECTNLHITYPAMAIGYLALLRGNRTLKDAIDAPDEASADEASEEREPDAGDVSEPSDEAMVTVPPSEAERIAANDIAILPDGRVSDGIVRFHSALAEMTNRHGIRDEISRYEAIALSVVEPDGDNAGLLFAGFPSESSPLRLENFFHRLYQRYEERFVLGAPLLAERGSTTRFEWSPDSPVFTRKEDSAAAWPALDFIPRLGSV